MKDGGPGINCLLPFGKYTTLDFAIASIRKGKFRKRKNTESYLCLEFLSPDYIGTPIWSSSVALTDNDSFRLRAKSLERLLTTLANTSMVKINTARNFSDLQDQWSRLKWLLIWRLEKVLQAYLNCGYITLPHTKGYYVRTFGEGSWILKCFPNTSILKWKLVRVKDLIFKKNYRRWTGYFSTAI